jgi:hypothetical protein
MRRAFVTSLLFAFVGFTLLFGIEFFLEWRRAGYPGVVRCQLGRRQQNAQARRRAVADGARVQQRPRDAARHDRPRDPADREHAHAEADRDVPPRPDQPDRADVHGVGRAHVLWVDYIIGPEFAPTWRSRSRWCSALVGWAMLLPYFFYVIRFLDPSRVLRPASRSTSTMLDASGRAASAIPAPLSRKQVRPHRSARHDHHQVARSHRSRCRRRGRVGAQAAARHYDKHKRRMPKRVVPSSIAPTSSGCRPRRSR